MPSLRVGPGWPGEAKRARAREQRQTVVRDVGFDVRGMADDTRAAHGAVFDGPEGVIAGR